MGFKFVIVDSETNKNWAWEHHWLSGKLALTEIVVMKQFVQFFNITKTTVLYFVISFKKQKRSYSKYRTDLILCILKLNPITGETT